MFELRKNDRSDLFGSEIEYVLPACDKHELRGKVQLINFSEAGICVLSATPLRVGQQIIITDFMSSSARTAVVIWVEKYHALSCSSVAGEVSYKIGLRFMGLNEINWESRALLT
jgi:hypothetical protein